MSFHFYFSLSLLLYRDADAALRDVSEERTAYMSLLQGAKGTISQLQDELTDARYVQIIIIVIVSIAIIFAIELLCICVAYKCNHKLLYLNQSYCNNVVRWNDVLRHN